MIEGSSGLGSLAQTARMKQIKVARGILLAIGILGTVGNAILYVTMESQIDAAIRQELNAVGMRGQVVDQAAVAKLRESAVRIGKLVQAGFIGVSMSFIVFGLTVKKYPVPITVAALVVYVGTIAIVALIVPSAALEGILIKIIVIAALVKSIQAAVAYQREKTRLESQTGFPVAPTGFPAS
jgi:hypothetical protein